MNPEFQLELQAYLDGELPEADARNLETLLQQDPAGRDLLAELRQTRSLLAGQEILRPLPESREFHWSKIARQIERESARHERSPVQGTWRHWMRTIFSPAGGVVAAVVLALAAFLWPQSQRESIALHELEITLPEAQTLTFHDQQERMTVVWLTYSE